MLHNRKNAKLTAESAFRIRQLYSSGGRTQAELAVEFGVSLTTIRNVLQGVTWQQVPMAVSAEEEAYKIQQSQESILRNLGSPPADAEFLKNINERVEGSEADPLEEILKRRSEPPDSESED